MNFSGFIIIIYLIIKLIKSTNNELIKEHVTLVEGVHFNERLPIKYISNGIELKKSIRRHYYKVLDIHSSPIINNDVVFEKYQKHLHYLKEDQLLVYKVKYSKNDLMAAQYYLDDLCEYYGNLN
jgi:hypothetical protein